MKKYYINENLLCYLGQDLEIFPEQKVTSDNHFKLVDTARYELDNLMRKRISIQLNLISLCITVFIFMLFLLIFGLKANYNKNEA